MNNQLWLQTKYNDKNEVYYVSWNTQPKRFNFHFINYAEYRRVFESLQRCEAAIEAAKEYLHQNILGRDLTPGCARAALSKIYEALQCEKRP